MNAVKKNPQVGLSSITSCLMTVRFFFLTAGMTWLASPPRSSWSAVTISLPLNAAEILALHSWAWACGADTIASAATIQKVRMGFTSCLTQAYALRLRGREIHYRGGQICSLADTRDRIARRC